MKTHSLLPMLCALALAAVAVRCGGSTNNSADASAPAGDDAAVAGPDAAPPGLDAGPACDPSRCAEGNVCVQDRCMLTCSRHVDCPNPDPNGIGYDCRSLPVENGFDAGFQSVCVANSAHYGSGMFGYGCGNGAPCATGYRCMGPQGTPKAYCTLENCTGDSDCPGNYWCATVDVLAPRDGGVPDTGPTADGSVAPPDTVPLPVCIKRDFCAPASGYVDCDATDAVYAVDPQGRGWCLRLCDGSDPNGCGPGNGCIMRFSQYECWPRGMTCAPASPTHYCSRCMSDEDCPAHAYCLTTWIGEPFCTAPCTSSKDCIWAGMPTDGNPGECVQFANGATQCYPGEIPDPNDPSTPNAASCWKPLPSDAGT